MAIELKNIHKSYGEKKVLQNMSLTLHPGEISCLMGASGIGKTTVVNILAGITSPDSGEIIWPSPLSVSVVFQEDRLLEWETALTNVLFVTRRGDRPRSSDFKLEAVRLLTKVGLADSINKKTAELSGGMKRRVAICRALITNPSFLLLDEPFKGLDSETKPIIMNMVKQHLTKENYMLCVTHDLSEVEFLNGKIISTRYSQ